MTRPPEFQQWDAEVERAAVRTRNQASVMAIVVLAAAAIGLAGLALLAIHVVLKVT